MYLIYTYQVTNLTFLTDFSLIAANSGLGAGRGTRIVAQAKLDADLSFLLKYPLYYLLILRHDCYLSYKGIPPCPFQCDMIFSCR